MDTPLVLLIILTLAFAATRLERAVLGDRVRLLAGMEYLVLGALFGPFAIGLLAQDQAHRLEPLISVLNGFVGFVAGLPLSSRRGDRAPARDVLLGLSVGVVATSLLGCLGYVALDRIAGSGPGRPADVALAAATLGLGAIVTSRWVITRLVTERRAVGALSSALPVAAATLRTLGILGVGVVLAAHRALQDGDSGAWGVVGWTAVSILGGVLSGVVFHVFVGARAEREKLFVAVLGLVGLASGIAHALAVSSIFIGLVAGATVAALSADADRVSAALGRLERPFFVVLLLLAGADWVPVSGAGWALAMGFIAVRVVVQRVGGLLGGALHPALRGRIPTLGNAFVHQSVVVVAVAVNLRMVVDHEAARIVATTLLLSALLNPIWGARAVVRVLQDAGETGRGEPAASPAAAGPFGEDTL